MSSYFEQITEYPVKQHRTARENVWFMIIIIAKWKWLGVLTRLMLGESLLDLLAAVQKKEIKLNLKIFDVIYKNNVQGSRWKSSEPRSIRNPHAHQTICLGSDILAPNTNKQYWSEWYPSTLWHKINWKSSAPCIAFSCVEKCIPAPAKKQCSLSWGPGNKERILPSHNGRKNPKYPKQTSSLPCRPVLPSDLSSFILLWYGPPSSSRRCPHSRSLFVSRQQGNGGLSRERRDRQTER